MVIREKYLELLRAYREKRLIKVVSGIRRCGKSTLLEMFQRELLAGGLETRQIISLNFEDMAFRNLLTADTLYDHIEKRIADAKMNYIFLDEIQMVADFERVANSLFIKKNVDLYITGSNAYFLSSELATLLTGRYIEIKMLPFSFKEYVSAFPQPLDLQQAYEKYVEFGSFPQSVELYRENPALVSKYLQSVYDTVIYKDIVARKNIKNTMILQDVTKFLFDNIGNVTASKRIADYLTAHQRKTSYHTVESYISALADSFVIYPLNRFDIKGKTILQTLKKYYVVDMAFRRLLSDASPADYGNVLENVIFLELIRRYDKVWIGKNRDSEIDFVVKDTDGYIYFQVALTVRDEKTKKRELAAFGVRDNYKKILLTMDPEEGSIDGILQRNALKWLLE
ncbi:MAG: ATP-binding protein [Acidobacteriota bacterium]|jgi:predicted AAA+ superfamily ATPase|nr:ATP-binding protein [Acidobacteriota bacterium]